MISTNIWVWVNAIVALGLLSLIFKPENPFYEVIENLTVAVVTANLTIVSLQYVYNNGTTPFLAGKDSLLILPIMLGLLIMVRLLPRKWHWISRFSTSFMLAIGLGISITSFTKGDIVNQIALTILPVLTPDPMTNINNLLIIVGTATSFYFFSYSRLKPSKAEQMIARIGRVFLMVSFGVGFAGYTLTYLGSMQGTLNYLIKAWLGL